jgi:hypothetical protein
MIQKTKKNTIKKILKKTKKIRNKNLKRIGGGDISINNVFGFFEIDDRNREYLKNTIADILGLYTLVNWKHDTHYTYSEKKGENAIKLYNIPDNQDINKNVKRKNTFTINSIQTSTKTNQQYKYLGTFYKKTMNSNFDFKCIILQNIKDNNIIILFKWGTQVDLMSEEKLHPERNAEHAEQYHNQTAPKILDKMYEFIKMKLLELNEKEPNILLFGHSMGGNIAQHIALRFLNDKIDTQYKDNLFLVSLGIGGTLPADDLKDKLESGLSNRFISIGLVSYALPELLPMNETKLHMFSSYTLNSFMIPTKPDYKTLKTIIINFATDYESNEFKLLKTYDFKNVPIDIDKSASDIHEFKTYYRAILDILIDNAK